MSIFSILLVDDEDNILRSLRRILSCNEYNIFTANTAGEGKQILIDEKIDLIISDQKMPGLTGLEFLEQTIKDFPDLIRIILTGHAELGDALRAINEGCIYKFILKPWNNEDLKITVRRALEQKELILANRYLTNELKKRDRLLRDLEEKYPGITEKPDNGIYQIT